jgi:hypothetical protein
MHQLDDSSPGEAIPKTPLRAVYFSQRMAANRRIHTCVDALRELLQNRKSHGYVKPIQ